MTPEEFAALRRELSEEITTTLVGLFTTLGAWRAVNMDVFLEQAIPVIRGGQTALANSVSAWVALRASEALGRAIAPPSLPEMFNLRRGVSDTEVYQRPFSTLYNALSEGKSLDEAVHMGEVRLREITEMDLQQTYAEASRESMQGLPGDIRPRFWRRTLEGDENCAMCVVASTQRYRVENLNPIHPGCDCGVDPIFGEDPGQVINEERLEQAHQAVEELTGQSDRGAREPDYRKVMTSITEEHGEVGELLVRPRDHFAGPGDL